MSEVDLKAMDVPQLVTHARSFGINTQGMRREEIEDEITLAMQPSTPKQDDRRLAVLEDIVKAISPVLEQLQADVKQLQFATGLSEPESDKENKDA